MRTQPLFMYFILLIIIVLVGEHQARQQQIIKVQEDIELYHNSLVSMVEKLDSANQELDQILNIGKKELRATQYATEGKYIIINEKYETRAFFKKNVSS